MSTFFFFFFKFHDVSYKGMLGFDKVGLFIKRSSALVSTSQIMF